MEVVVTEHNEHGSCVECGTHYAIATEVRTSRGVVTLCVTCAAKFTAKLSVLGFVLRLADGSSCGIDDTSSTNFVHSTRHRLPKPRATNPLTALVD